VTAGNRDGGQAQTDILVRGHVREWLEGMGGGAFYSLLFCTVLAQQLGWGDDARTLRNAVAADLDRRRDELPLTALPAFNLLAPAADDEGDYASSERWAERALTMLSAFETRRQTISEPVKPAGLRQIADQWFAAFLQLGRSRAARGDTAGAREAFVRARQV